MTWVALPIDGGLDLITAPQAITPGRLAACLNYEVARQRGIRRIDGYEKYDGGQSPSSAGSTLLLLGIQSAFPPDLMAVGDLVHLTDTGYGNLYGSLVSFADGGLYNGLNLVSIAVKMNVALPYSVASIVGTVGLALFDDTTTNSYNILTATQGFAGGIPTPTSLVLEAIASSPQAGALSLIPGAEYAYRVSAVNANGESFASVEATITMPSIANGTTTGAVSLISGNWNLPVTGGSWQVGQWIYVASGSDSIVGPVILVFGAGGVTTNVRIDGSKAITTGTPASITIGSNIVIMSYVALGWDFPTVPANVPPITGYNVYGRTAGAEQLLANTGFLGGNFIPYFIDTGRLTPNGALPTVNTSGSVSTYLDNLADFFTTVSATVQPVPGQGSVNGLFWLKDVLYATRDYYALNFTTGVLHPAIGDVLFQGASYAAATWTGQLAKMAGLTGDWTDGNAAGVMMVYNTIGTLTAAVVKNHTQADATCATATSFGAASATSTAAGLYAANGGRGDTLSTQSWQWCDLGWTIQYKSGTHAFVDMNFALTADQSAQYVTTGWKTATAVSGGSQWGFNGASFALFTTANIAAPADSNYNGWTFHVGTGNFPNVQGVFITGFGFTDSDIPPTASIVGIELQMTQGVVGYTTHYTASVAEKTVQLVGVTGTTPNLAASVPYATTGIVGSGTVPYPSAYSSYNWTNKHWGAPTTVANTPTSLLGYHGITPADVVKTSFGLNLAWVLQGTQTGQQLQLGIDYVALRIAYLPQTNLVYFWNVGATSPSAVKAQVVIHYKQGGDIGTSNETGTVYFQFIQSDGTVGGIPSRPIGSDEQIRTLPANGTVPDGGGGDGSTLIALTATAADMNVMDWSALLQGAPQSDGSVLPKSKYQSVTKNFYASSGYEAIYGVSGGGPAFYFDGPKQNAAGATVPGNFSRILTGLPLQLETPRSITDHQGHIVLGYASGVYQWGNAENVLSFDPLRFDRTAGNAGVGEQLTALKSVNGDTLIIGAHSAIYMAQGNFNTPGAQSGPYQSVVSPTSGMIEYTLQPMANYVYCDFRGLTMVGTTQKYGDFELGHISSDVAPWIIPRVQLSAFFESANAGIINAVLVRNKNQYRAYFADGYVLTMTFLRDGENPQFTIQHYTASDGATALTWDVIQAFTESLGRDRVFGATADGSGTVYELDRGNSFNGAAINAYASLVPDTGQVPYQNKKYSGINVYGQAQDYAAFTLSRSANYDIPSEATGANVINQTFGNLTAAPTGMVNPFASIGTSALQIEGTAINLRFDSSSNTQYPHVIQAVSYTVDPLNARQG